MVAGIGLLACGTPPPIKIEGSLGNCTWLQGGGGTNRAAYAAIPSDSSPQLLWSKELKTPLLLEPTASMGVMILPTANRRFDMVSLKDGKYLGQIKARGTLVSPCGLDDSLVVLNEFGQHLRVQNWVTNETAWEVDLADMVQEPLIMSGRVFWFDGEKKLYCYDIKGGKKVWEKRIDNGLAAPPAATSTKMLIVSNKNEIDCISPDDAKPIWKDTFKAHVRITPVIYDSSAFVSTMGGDIIRMNIENGAEQWSTNIGSAVFAPLATDGEGIFVGTNNGELVRLNYQTGEVEWRFGTDGPIKAGVTVVGDLVIMAGLDHHVYFVDKKLGSVKFDYETKGMITARPVVCANRVYVAGEDKTLYCFKINNEE